MFFIGLSFFVYMINLIMCMWFYFMGIGFCFMNEVLFIFLCGNCVIKGVFYFFWWMCVFEVYINNSNINVVWC